MSIKLAAACVCALVLAVGRPAMAQHLSAPGNLVYTPNGQLLVASGNGIATFQADGTYVGRFATTTGAPHRLALDRNQDLFIGYATSPDVEVFSQAGKLLRTLRNTGGVGLAVLANDDLVSIQSASAELFDKVGTLLHTYTQDKQKQPFPGGVAVTIGTAMYYVADPAHGNARVETFSVTSILAGLPAEREHFINTGSPHPTQVAVDAKAAVYIVGATNTLTVYSHPGAVLLSVTGLAAPGGVAVDPSGNIYVAETAADDVKVFSATGSLLRTIR